MWVEISFPLAIDNFFTYEVPQHLKLEVAVGKRVLAPFKGAKKNWKTLPKSLSHQDFETFILNQGLLEEEEKWILEIYKKTPKRFMLKADITPEEEKKLFKILKGLRGTRLGVIVKIESKKPLFKTLFLQKILDTTPFFTPYTLSLAQWISNYYGCYFNEALALFIPTAQKTLNYSYPLTNFPPLYPLNPQQEEIFKEIKNYLTTFYPALIFGVTGSGKTEVYRHLAKEILDLKKQVLVLVPEISLTPQTVERFASLCGPENIAVIHSKLDSKEKLYQFHQIQLGKAKIILGPRSALFAPFLDLGLIIIDEEHENSYKSAESPRYHAKQVAFTLAKTLQIPLILGSATPSLETFYAGKTNQIKLFSLKNRHKDIPLPKVLLVDLKKEKGEFSPLLVKKIYENHQNKKQTILFMNRRGFSPFILCKKCGYRFECPHCSVSLTYHKEDQIFACHTCGYEEAKPVVCAACGYDALSILGMGTEKLEAEMKQLFLKMEVLRMDRDTTLKKGGHEVILNAFKEGKANILVGTQMIAKGLDFPNVQLVGVVWADISLNLPDFRSGEKTFSLLTQVAGRSGRKESGEVIIQTLNPQHFVLQKVKNHDYEGFYQNEIQLRKKYLYPPFIRLIRLVIRGEDLQKVKVLTQKTQDFFTKKKISFLGPTPCFFERMNKNYRFQIIFKVNNPLPLVNLIKKEVLGFFKSQRVFLEVDVDPVSLL